MVKFSLKRYLLIAAGLVVVGGGWNLLGSSALAHEGSESDVYIPKRIDDSSNKKRSASEKFKAESQERRGKLHDSRLKACQNKEKAINNIMSRLASRGEKKVAVLTAVAERVKTFKEDKNLTVANYDSLVAEVNAKKSAADAAVAAVKAAQVDFKCDGSDPVGASQSFLTHLRNQNKAIKDYKTAVKNLVRAVKAANEGSQQ